MVSPPRYRCHLGCILLKTDIVADRWQVDLGSVQEIRAVQLVNRADCCELQKSTTRPIDGRPFTSATPSKSRRAATLAVGPLQTRNCCCSVSGRL